MDGVCTALLSLLGDLFEIFHWKEFKGKKPPPYYVSQVKGVVITSLILKQRWRPCFLSVALFSTPLLLKVGPTNTISLEC